jgi:hypothetical protein
VALLWHSVVTLLQVLHSVKQCYIFLHSVTQCYIVLQSVDSVTDTNPTPTVLHSVNTHTNGLTLTPPLNKDSVTLVTLLPVYILDNTP